MSSAGIEALLVSQGTSDVFMQDDSFFFRAYLVGISGEPVKFLFQNRADQAIGSGLIKQCPLAGFFQPVFAVLLLQREHTSTTLVGLLRMRGA